MRKIQLNCKKDNHYYKPILGVCIDQQCLEEKPYCLECQQQFYQHEKCKLLRFEQLPQWFIQYFDKLENTQKYMSKCQQLIEILYNKLEQLGITQLNILFKEMIIIEKIFEKLQNELNQTIQQLEKVNHKYNSLSQNELIPLLENQISEDQKKYSKPFTPQKNEKYNFTKQPTIQNPIQFLDVKFQNEQRNSDVEIINNGKLVRCLKSQHFVIGQPIIPKNDITKFAIKLLNPVSYVALGVGNKEILKQNKYNVDLYNQSTHGTYLINSHGIVFSHSFQKKPNLSGFSFQANDTIIIELNMKESKITWTRMADHTNISIQFNKSLDLYPLLTLNQTSVSVVDSI